MTEHKIHRVHEGVGMDRKTTAVCSCGWRSLTEDANNDYCWSNLEEQADEHRKYFEELNERHFLPSELMDFGMCRTQEEDE